MVIFIFNVIWLRRFIMVVYIIKEYLTVLTMGLHAWRFAMIIVTIVLDLLFVIIVFANNNTRRLSKNSVFPS